MTNRPNHHLIIADAPATCPVAEDGIHFDDGNDNCHYCYCSL